MGVLSCRSTGVRSDGSSLCLRFISDRVFIRETKLEIRENDTLVLIDHKNQAAQRM